MEEQWRPIAGYEGVYSVSDHGRVFSHKRIVVASNRSYWIQDRVLKNTVYKNSIGIQYYNVVGLADGVKSRMHKVAGLVATAFLGPRPEGCVCRHLDGNGLNDKLSNLKWGTHLENSEDSYAHGTFVHGDASVKRKIDSATAYAIYKFRGRATEREASEMFGVTPHIVYGIWRYGKWRKTIAEIEAGLHPHLVR
ncbi:endonuclease [EBPR siphovirus 2]|nr:endonuclease [EBPR siphovirus 2]